MGSGFWGWGAAAAAAAAGQAIFLRCLSVVGALVLSLWDGFDGPRERSAFPTGFGPQHCSIGPNKHCWRSIALPSTWGARPGSSLLTGATGRRSPRRSTDPYR